eukprot:CAMPEP_0168483692 /NCGR_PEP_ID=MMETSP0228-20121227/65707_1 /TAXON_ID=133427 /ORGANISM="Protoceratium reticulatum, Strain CCCM 535 (=CCMP 1889)" /LENGTH=52 /DNA_ID=CAMNT_0008500197 /DNA_START=89 /DNA_END=244 /DNA_ORIENTATION=+
MHNRQLAAKAQPKLACDGTRPLRPIDRALQEGVNLPQFCPHACQTYSGASVR